MKNLKRFDEAEKLYKKALEKSIGNPMPYNGLGNLYSTMGNHKKAQQLFNQGLELDPDNWVLRYNQAKCFRDQKKYERALLHFEKLLDTTPSKFLVEVQVNLAQCFNALKDYEKAIIYWNLALEVGPVHQRFYYYHNLASAYERLDKPVEAFQKCLKASESVCLEPDEFDRLQGLYRAVSHFGVTSDLYRRLTQYLQEYVLSQPASDVGNYFLAFTYNKKGEYKKAEIYATKAIDLNPSHPRNYYQLANAFYGQSQHKACIKVLKRMLEIDPLDYYEAQRALACVYRKQGQQKKAVQMESRLDSIRDLRDSVKDAPQYAREGELRFCLFND